MPIHTPPAGLGVLAGVVRYSEGKSSQAVCQLLTLTQTLPTHPSHMLT